MSKTIRVTDGVYELILKYQGVRESQSHVLERSFDAFETIDKIKRGEFTPLGRHETTKEEVR